MSLRNLYICVLSSPSDDDPEALSSYDPSPYLLGYQWEQPLLQYKNISDQIDALIKKGVDVFLNLTSGATDDWVYGIEKILLEKNAPFTGAYGAFFDPSRKEMKDAAEKAGVPFPGSVFAYTEEDLTRAAESLKFPLIVKPLHGFGSTSIRKESRVLNKEELFKQAHLTKEDFGAYSTHTEGVLIEEFIDGRELTCLVCENLEDPSRPHSFRPVEYLFPEGESFKHADMKWTNAAQLMPVSIHEPDVESKLRNYSERMFAAMNGNGYARLDYRMDKDGNIYMLEINPNCGIFDDPKDPACADSILKNDPIGHRGFLDLILTNAIKRREQNIQKA